MLVRIVGHATHIAQNAMVVISSNVLHADKDILKLIKIYQSKTFRAMFLSLNFGISFHHEIVLLSDNEIFHILFLKNLFIR